MPERYEVRSWSDLSAEQQLKFWFDWYHGGVCDPAVPACVLGDAEDELASDAFETVLAAYAPDFIWQPRPRLSTISGAPEAEFAIYLLPTVLDCAGRYLPQETKVSRYIGDGRPAVWEWREF